MINDTRRKAQGQSEELLSQWPRFNERTFLRQDCGLNFDRFFDLFEANPFRFYLKFLQVIELGKVADLALEQYRNLDLRNLNVSQLISHKSLSAFPLTFMKIGTTHAGGELNPANYDVDQADALEFSHININYLFAPLVSLNGLNIDNCNVRYAYFAKAVLKNFTLENSLFYKVVFADQDNSITLQSGNIENCQFIGSEWYNSTSFTDEDTAVQFKNCLFRNCIMIAPDDVLSSVLYGDFVNCSFENGTLDFRFNSLKLCRFQGVTVQDSLNSNSANTTDCEFDSVDFADTVFSGSLRSCTFNNCDLSASTFDWSLDIRGTSFENAILPSSIFSVPSQPTKAELRAAVLKYDASTLWIDGSPLTED